VANSFNKLQQQMPKIHNCMMTGFCIVPHQSAENYIRVGNYVEKTLFKHKNCSTCYVYFLHYNLTCFL